MSVVLYLVQELVYLQHQGHPLYNKRNETKTVSTQAFVRQGYGYNLPIRSHLAPESAWNKGVS